MAKSTQAYLTFAVTVKQTKGVAIPDVRKLILRGLADQGFDVGDVKIHLTNKEVKYGA